MAKGIKSIFYYSLSFLIALASCSDDVCEQKSPCLCDFSDDYQLDLSQLMPHQDFAQATKDNLTYYYHGCTNMKFDINIENITSDTCTEPLTLCLFDATNRTLRAMGYANETHFSAAPSNAYLYEIKYKKNFITTRVLLVCTPGLNDVDLLFHNISGKEHVLHLFSPHLCKFQTHHGMSTGAKFFVMLLVFISIYFIGGCCISYFIMGARGREMIPNHDFWMRVGESIKNGVYFVTHGCNRRMVSTSETYDQI